MRTVSFPDFLRTSSPFSINVPTRSALVLAKIDSFVIVVTNLNNKNNVYKKRCLFVHNAKTETTAQVDLKTGLTNWIAAEAHNPERSTAINSCNGVFTSEFIFR